MEIESKNPNLFVLGAPKCGTTSIVHYLQQHPNVFTSNPKEPHYFNLDSGHRYYFEESKYLGLFDSAEPTHKYRLEGSVWYLYSKEAVDHILAFDPNAKFIVALRDPISMFFSLFTELKYGGAEHLDTPLEGWNAQEPRALGKQLGKGVSDPTHLQYGKVCKLGEQCSRLLSKVNRSNVLFVFLEDLAKDPDKIYLEIQSFLELDAISLDSYEVVNAKKARRSKRLSNVLIGATYLKRRLGLNKGLGLANWINKKNVTQKVDNWSEDREQLTPELKRYFKEDVRLLEQVLNRNLSHWLS